MARTLIITNDFPPRVGGIESFIRDVVDLLDSDVVVLTSSTRDGRAFDQTLKVEVVRAGPVLLPTPLLTRQAVGLLRRTGASRVLFGAAAPLGLMAAALRKAGASRLVALSHGHEAWWATVPGARWLLRRLADRVDHVSTISDYTAGRIAPALSPAARTRLIRLAPPVDVDVFRPAVEPRSGNEPPRAVAVGRLVRQKGFDTLLQAWRRVLARWPGTALRPELVIVGDGPRRHALTRLAGALGVTDSVVWAGAKPRWAVVAELQQADVFALPVRTRLAGLNPEGLGLAALEAAACGLPVIVGNSGGAPETLIDTETGFVVGSDSPEELAYRLGSLLDDRGRAREMGSAGRRYVTARFGFAQARATLRAALDLPGTSGNGEGWDHESS